MEYSKDIMLECRLAKESEKDERKTIFSMVKNHKIMTAIIISCGLLMTLDYILVQSFIELLQRI